MVGKNLTSKNSSWLERHYNQIVRKRGIKRAHWTFILDPYFHQGNMHFANCRLIWEEAKAYD